MRFPESQNKNLFLDLWSRVEEYPKTFYSSNFEVFEACIDPIPRP